MVPDPAIAVLTALEREGVWYAELGAIALGLHGLPRFTEDLETERAVREGFEVTVVTPRQLFRMKGCTVRPKDWADAEALAVRFRPGPE